MKSRFSHRFNTNYVPSDEEIECIRTDLVSHTQELARIDERIRELSAQRDQIQDYIGSHKALISHPRRLPVDILREIFVACLPVDRNAVMSAQEAPLLLGRICSAWRSIVLTTPRLWASLHASFDYIAAKSQRKFAVAEWLGRSAACPISLSLSDLGWDNGSLDISELLKSLIDFGNRWRHVEFIGLSTARASELARIRAPAPESLRFTGNVSLLCDLDFIKVPTLRTVALESYNDDFKDLVLTMPFVWSQLTHLTLKCYEGFSVSNAVVLLGRCTHLISFQVTLKEPDPEIVDTISGPISLPSLTTLIMTRDSMNSQSLSHLIEHVSMPQLHKFHVASLQVPDCSFMVDIGKGSPLLEELGDLYLPLLSAESFPVGLRSLPSLTKIVVSDSYDSHYSSHLFNSAQLLELLTPGPSDTTICSALQELVMCNCSDLKEETLDAFIQKRAEFTRGFRRLEFRNPRNPDIVSKDQIHSYLSQAQEPPCECAINQSTGPRGFIPFLIPLHRRASERDHRTTKETGPKKVNCLSLVVRYRRRRLHQLFHSLSHEKAAYIPALKQVNGVWFQKGRSWWLCSPPSYYSQPSQSAMESRFSHRFNTNYVPSDEEIECIRTDLVSHTQELARIDERIREFSAQRDQIQAYIGSHKALISHPRRLPVDILREIFVACLPVGRNAVMSAQEAPLLLGRICSAWRTIALTTPRLWASLHVSFDYIVAKSQRRPAVAEWLRRSAACPISLSLSDLKWDDGSPDTSVLLKSLIDFGNRWRHVEFIHLSTARASELTRIRAPALESLRFTGNVSLLCDLDFIKVPTLRTVALESHNDNFKDLVLAMPFVWGQLTHLTLICYEGFSLSNAVVLLGRCTHLVSFQVSLKEPDLEMVDTISGPISLPFLTTLITTRLSLNPQSLSHLIEHVSMPQLHKFHVASLKVPDCSFMVDIGKGSPLLEELGNLHLPSLSAESLLVGLRSFSSLAKLFVSDFDNWDNSPILFDSVQLLELLTPGPSDTTICSALQELVMCGCSDLKEETLDAFIQKRAEFTRCFRRLEFRNPLNPDIVSKDQIHSYLSQGVNVSIVHDAWMEPPSPWTGLPT
ncbi:hypothetical protein DFH08DRAFT_769191 [Mycena albidolilacea]|uniref:F-box domain-containing protein n=1 Tax=Mycena albidolilacea TaxID=1033008 RepID=A0AAD7EZ13_9AGAR|nr:hypothetical protein DFH08DRAFT_769191 [Mycena albidolilacea]